MAKIELRTNNNGETAQLLVDGVDVSRQVRRVSITFDPMDRGWVQVEYRAKDISVDGDFELSEREV